MKSRLLVLAVLFVAMVARSEPREPASAEILARVRPGHPRLLANAEDFSRLREKMVTQPQVAEWAAAIRRSADGVLAAQPSRYEIPDGKRLLTTSRRVLDRTLTLGLTFRLTGDERYRERLWQELDAAANFPDWNPSHFLDVAEMTAAFAIGYDWLHREWTPEQRAALQTAIQTKGLHPSLETYRKDRSWAKAEHNWNQVCNGGMVLGALALADVQPALAGEILAAAIQTVPRAMRHFAPDGAWGEGTSYWDYATKYNVLLLAALESALGTDYGLSQLEGFSAAGDFPIHLTGPLGRTFNYADAGEKGGGGPQMLWLATKYEKPAYATWRLATVRGKPTALDLLWGAAWLERRPATNVLPLAKHFRGAEIVTMRSGWEDPLATFVGFKGGDNQVNHGHLDLGSFVLDARGQRWAVDVGLDDYNLPGYFGRGRWSYYRCRAEGQNTLVLNPVAVPDQELKATAQITRFESGAEQAFAIVDLTAAYAGSASSVQRGIRRDGLKVLVQDEVRATEPVELWWFMHTEAEIVADGEVATLKLGGEQLVVRVIEPEGVKFEVMAAKPLPGSPHPPRQQVKGTGSNRGAGGVRKLAIRLEGVTNTTVAVQFQMADGEAISGGVVPLGSWQGAAK